MNAEFFKLLQLQRAPDYIEHLYPTNRVRMKWGWCTPETITAFRTAVRKLDYKCEYSSTGNGLNIWIGKDEYLEMCDASTTGKIWGRAYKRNSGDDDKPPMERHVSQSPLRALAREYVRIFELDPCNATLIEKARYVEGSSDAFDGPIGQAVYAHVLKLIGQIGEKSIDRRVKEEV